VITVGSRRRQPGGTTGGVEAVIDKDLASALLAQRLGADALLMLTDVPAVERDWRTPAARPVARATPAELRALRFEPGSMGPKVEATCRCSEAGGRLAVIGALADAVAMLRDEAGANVVPDSGHGGAEANDAVAH
jgi:carbamate kinase